MITNPFDKITEPERMPNPGFWCQQFIETNSHVKKYWPKQLCTTQCQSCIDKVLDHHAKKLKP
jgi:hypothetical protein